MITCYVDQFHFAHNTTIATHYSDISWPLHNHEYWEIQLCIGELTQLYNGKRIVSNPYEVLILRPFIDSHRLFNGNAIVIKIADEKFKEICDFVSSDLYDAIKTERIPLLLSLSADEGKDIADYHSNILTITDLDKATRDNVAITTLSTISILKHYLLKLLISPSTVQTPSWLNTLVKNLQDPVNFSRNLGELTADWSYSYMQISRMFKRYLNQSPNEFFLKCRLSYARNLLISTHMPLAQVCLATGYESAGHFNQSFKKLYGVTPREYRKTKGGIKF